MIWLWAAVALAASGPYEVDSCAAWAEAQPWATQNVRWIDADHPQASDRNDGSPSTPWRSPTALRRTGALNPGDAVVFRGGLYRDAIRPATYGRPGQRITFAACPGEQVLISGSDPWTASWTKDAAGWTTFAAVGRRPESRYSALIMIADGRVLLPAPSDEPLAPGTFHAVGAGDGRARVTVRLPQDADPNRVSMEIGRRGTLFGSRKGSPSCPDDPDAGGFHLIGIRFLHSASPAQRGTVCVGGRDSIVEDVTVSWSNGLGIEVRGLGHEIRRSGAQDNGQAGIGGSCRGCLLEDTWSVRNNWRNHDRFWEAGGGKWADTHDTRFIRHTAVGNDGVGLWLDGNATGNRIETAWLVDNVIAGLMLELGSDKNTVVNSVMARTKRRGWSASGVLVQAATDNVLRFNTIVENEGSGLWLRADDRRTTGPHIIEYNQISNNNTGGRRDDHDVRVDRDTGPARTTASCDDEVTVDFDGLARPVGCAGEGAFTRGRGRVSQLLNQSWHEIR